MFDCVANCEHGKCESIRVWHKSAHDVTVIPDCSKEKVDEKLMSVSEENLR